MDELAATLDDELGTDELALGGDGVRIVARFDLNPAGLSIDIYPGDPFRTPAEAGFNELGGAYHFIVRARLPIIDVDAAQDALLDLMDDEHNLCVAAILEDDQTLGGLASSVDVTGPTGFQPFAELLGVQWFVRVLPNVT